MRHALALTLFAALPLAAAGNEWILDQSTVSYHISHPLHQANGVSKQARGKGSCHDGQCDFLIAAPVKSFDSGDSNRDLHMLQVVHGAEFPLVTVRTRLPQSAAKTGTVMADLDVEFAGQTAHFSQVPFQVTVKGNSVTVAGTIPATLSDFKIDPPKLLTVPVKNEMPVKVEMTWHSQ